MRYPVEKLAEDDDDGTMPENVAKLEESVVGHRIVSAEKSTDEEGSYWRSSSALVLTLDDGRRRPGRTNGPVLVPNEVYATRGRWASA